MEFQEIKLNRFDQVQLLTTKHVTYLSTPLDASPSPKGTWSVVAAIGDELLLAKQSTIIRIPAVDVRRIIEYDLNKIRDQLDRMLDYGKDGKSGEQAGQDPR